MRTHEPNSTTFRWRMILFDRTFSKISCTKFKAVLNTIQFCIENKNTPQRLNAIISIYFTIRYVCVCDRNVHWLNNIR